MNIGAGSAVVLAVLVVLLAGWRWRPAPRRLRTLIGRRPVPATDPGPDRRAPQRWPAWAGRTGRGAAWVLGGLVVLGLWPPGVVLLAAGAWCRPRVRALRRRRAERAAVTAGLPDALDLLVLTVGSGLTISLAVDGLARVALPPFGAAFGEVRHRADRGLRLADALSALPERLGSPVHRLTAALVAAERYGVALGPTLEQLALEARRERARQSEVAARKLPVRLSFPLVCCILPAFGLLTLAPLLAGALGSLRL